MKRAKTACDGCRHQREDGTCKIPRKACDLMFSGKVCFKKLVIKKSKEMKFQSLKQMIRYFENLDLDRQDDRERARDAMNEPDFEHLDQGGFYHVHKITLSGKSYAVKFLYEVACHNREYCQMFPKPGTKIGKHFLYPVWASPCHRLIVQPLADCTWEARWKAKDLLDVRWSDPRTENFGMYRGKPVIIDYYHRRY